MEHQLKTVQDDVVASGSSRAQAIIEWLESCANLRKVMRVNTEMYLDFMVSFLSHFLGSILKLNCTCYSGMSETLQ